MTRWMWAAMCAVGAVSASGCDETVETPPPATTIAEGAEVSYELVYQAPSYTGFGLVDRPWIPVDLSGSESGQLWVIQRLPRDPAFDDETECTSRSQAGEANYCGGLQGSTATISDPAALEPATVDNGRVRLVVDANAWHFMRRPSAIAMGAPRIELPLTEPGALDPVTGEPLGSDTLVYTDTFGTCHEHWTGNFTDQGAFIGPSLWTGDPAIYNGINGTEAWSNGAHLDMVHATQYCMGIAHERDNVYWVFNGAIGAVERYDFVRPHVPGHSYHEDGLVTRYDLTANPLARLEDVPSNMIIEGTDLYIADTGNGRVVRFDTAQPTTLFNTFLTFEAIEAELRDGAVLVDLVNRETLALEWGARVEPSGLAFLDEHAVIANHGSGHITLVAQDGAVVRTLDTGLGAGLGGLTVLDGQIYFAHMGTRAVYRVDVVEPVEEM